MCQEKTFKEKKGVEMYLERAQKSCPAYSLTHEITAYDSQQNSKYYICSSVGIKSFKDVLNI